MNKYLLRKNFTATALGIRGKLAFKTKEMEWVDTFDPVIALVSVKSAFHEGAAGDLKMNAFISTIKANVKGVVTVLLADWAHLNVQSLECENAFDECLSRAKKLSLRYSPYFEGTKVVYWHSYICEDEYFGIASKAVRDLYENNPQFKEFVFQDAGTIHIEKNIEDILEQCACILVLAKKGYRFQFYPGKPYSSTEYLSKQYQVSWVNVFLSIEKKTFN